MLALPFATTLIAEEEEGEQARRSIEEVVVYGQREEATVSDTSISITAMDEDFLKDMGVQGPNEMVNFIPAATRTAWDVKIRGVGRNFRGLGGDPGIGTYYNGIYSSDFGIASTEGGLYDVKRIEVLRGPQGTLYGRNSIGGVINYVTNEANHDDFEASARVLVGEYNAKEFYGFLSGPVTENLAYRLVGVKRERDGAVPGHFGTEDVEDVNDQNVALTLNWNVTSNFNANLRINDRRSLRNGNFGDGGHGVTSEGPCVGVHPITSTGQCDPRYRVPRDTNHYAPGFRSVSQDYYNTYGDLADDPRGAVPWVHPVTGEIAYGAYVRPGVDNTDKWPYMPSANYMDPGVATYNIGDADSPDIIALTNNSAAEEFDHQMGQLTLDWDISDTLSMRYLGSYANFVYYFNRDNDYSSSLVSDNNDTVIEDVDSFSHELRIFWELGDRWTATTGFYNFREQREQFYGIRERAAQGRVANPTIYGTPEHEDWLIDALALVGWNLPGCMDYQTMPINSGPSVHPGYGRYCGELPDRTLFGNYDTGAVYEQHNFVESENLAFYTQGDYRFTDNFSVTLGVRYSKDDRTGLEQRGGYSELNANTYSAWLPWAIQTVMNGNEDVNWWEFYGEGVTGLAAMNVAMGAATFTGDPDFPIAPTCELTAVECATPLRLEGIPIGWGTRIDGKQDYDGEWTYRVNFNWEPTENILVYFGTTSGYRAGGWNMGADNRGMIDTDMSSFAGAPTGDLCEGDNVDLNADGDQTDNDGCDLRVMLDFQGEEITSYELGYKGTHLDGRLQVNVALYYYDYTDYQDNVYEWEEQGSFTLPSDVTLPDGSQLGPPAGRGPVEVTVNIPKAVNKGFEIDGLYLLTDNLTVGGNYSYTISEYDSQYTFFNETDPRYPRGVFGGDLSQNPCKMEGDLKALYCIEIDGYQLQGIPKHKATAWASYNWYFSSGTLTGLGSWSYTGEYDTSPFSTPWDEVPERDRLDLRFTFTEATGRWNASVFVDNVLDDTYIRQSDMNPRLTGYGSNYPQRVIALYPRFWGAEFTYNFGAAVQ
jgi:outer membrane receptor protein involved in Fe transport